MENLINNNDSLKKLINIDKFLYKDSKKIPKINIKARNKYNYNFIDFIPENNTEYPGLYIISTYGDIYVDIYSDLYLYRNIIYPHIKQKKRKLLGYSYEKY